MASTDAHPVPLKSVYFRVTFEIRKNDGSVISAASGLSALVSKDGGTFAAANGTVTEIATASGVYYLDLLPAEMTANTVAIKVTSSTTGAVPVVIVLYPADSTGGDIPVDMQRVYGSTDAAFNQSSVLASGIILGTVDTSTQAASTTAFEVSGTSFVQRATDFYAGASLIFLTGTLVGQRARVTGSTWSVAHSKISLTVTALTAVPGNSDKFALV